MIFKTNQWKKEAVMKKNWWIGPICLFTALCISTLFFPGRSQGGETMLKEKRKIVTSYLKTLESRDLEGLLALFTPDAVVHSPMYGKNSARKFYTDFFVDSKETNVTLLGFFDQGQGTDGKPLVGYWARFDWVLASGAHAPFDVVVVMELDDRDLIEALHIVMDTAFIRGVFEKETGRTSAGSKTK